GQRSEIGDRRSEIRGRRSEVRYQCGVWGMRIDSATELTVYRKAYELAMRIFTISARFPPEERFALTSQIRRSSRSVCLNLREAWAKRRYEAHFLSKLTDCDGENSETESALDFARDCRYISPHEHRELTELNTEVGKMLGAMLRAPQKFVTNNQ